jgi:protein-disulfide isomerase
MIIKRRFTMRFLRTTVMSLLLTASVTVLAQTPAPAAAPPAPTVVATPAAAPAVAAAPASATAAMNPAEKARIQALIYESIIQKPEVILEALQILQRKQYESAQQTMRDTQTIAAQFAAPLFKQPNDPVAGNPNGKITIVEFFDYQCPHCIDMVPVIDTILKANPEVRLVYKEFPVRGPMSEVAAKAALAAHKQGKYTAFSHALLAYNKPLNEAVIYQVAGSVAGLNVEQLKKDMKDVSVENQLKANFKLAQDLKLFGTPAFFITKTDMTNLKNIYYVPGQLNKDQLQDAINKASK